MTGPSGYPSTRKVPSHRISPLPHEQQSIASIPMDMMHAMLGELLPAAVTIKRIQCTALQICIDVHQAMQGPNRRRCGYITADENQTFSLKPLIHTIIETSRLHGLADSTSEASPRKAPSITPLHAHLPSHLNHPQPALTRNDSVVSRGISRY